MSALDLLRLDQLPGVGPVTVRGLVDRFGGAAQALAAPEAAFAELCGIEAARARQDAGLRRTIERALARAHRLHMHVLTWDDAAYPARLRHLPDPPPVLFLRGRSELLGARPMVTVVGARRSTERGRSVAERIGAACARADVCLASGLALGIDGAAHAGTLRAGGDTLAVLGAAIDVPYPRLHRRLHARIADSGLLVSEFLPGTRAAPHHFPRRNRILAALAHTTVVVEAGPRSGSLITVDHALDLGREVWAVPGPIDVPTCAGSNRMLVDGARPLVSIPDFVSDLRTGSAGGDPSRIPSFVSASGAAGAVDPAGVSPTHLLERSIVGALREQSHSADELAARFGAPVGSVLAILTTLELHGEVIRLGGSRFRTAA